MARYLVSILILLSVAAPSLATTNFIYPLPTWHVSTHHGEDIGGGLYHMGVDVGFDEPAGAAVYAVADGIVREAQERSQFGLVVLIEHYPDDSGANVSLYGHLDPTDVRVTPGQTVHAGDVIGVLGTTDNNGGWPVHLHFGIHTQPYTGDWVYYGHVYDAATAADWYDPETYIPEHLITDDWDPQISLDLMNNDVVGDTLLLSGSVGDVGSGLRKVRVKASSDGVTWDTLALDQDPDYNLENALDISDYPDGTFFLKVIARDAFHHKTNVTRTVTKDPYRYATPAFVAMKGGDGDAFITQWSFGGTALNAYFPFKQHWDKGGLLAVGDLYDGDTTEIIALRQTKKNTTPILKVLTSNGDIKTHFQLPGITPRAVTSGKGTIYIAQPLNGYDTAGNIIWTPTAFDATAVITDLTVDTTTLYVCWTANDQSRLSMIDLASGTLTRTVRPLRKTATTGCQVTSGDFTGDGSPELAVASNGGLAGTVRLLTLDGQPIGEAFQPFGDEFTGQIDLSTVQWDATEDGTIEDELLVSQGSEGQAWVKTYRLSGDTEVAYLDRIYEEEFTAGTHIVGWP